ncbi:unnamed protein product [Musa hybrid cultivar]
MAKACDKGRALDVASCPSLLRRGTGFVPEKGSTCPNSWSKAVRGVASLEPYILHRVSASCSCARRLLLVPLSDPPFSSSSDLIFMEIWGMEIKPEETVKDNLGEEQICASFSDACYCGVE